MAAHTGVTVVLDDVQEVAVDVERVVEVAVRAATVEGASGEISITLVDEKAMADLNHRYMSHAGPTDVLSFPIDGKNPQCPDCKTPVLIGEVVLCPAYAAKNNPDLDEEIDLLVTHGVLHLLGYDHNTKTSTELMRSAEFSVIGRSGAEGP
ncbi:MAG: rRNA maturation RNase YbeY [Actinomycetota bacterium]